MRIALVYLACPESSGFDIPPLGVPKRRYSLRHCEEQSDVAIYTLNAIRYTLNFIRYKFTLPVPHKIANLRYLVRETKPKGREESIKNLSLRTK